MVQFALLNPAEKEGGVKKTKKGPKQQTIPTYFIDASKESHEALH